MPFRLFQQPAKKEDPPTANFGPAAIDFFRLADYYIARLLTHRLHIAKNQF
jgi:hypothetical protein